MGSELNDAINRKVRAELNDAINRKVRAELNGVINREVRFMNRNFSLAEYGSAWTKMERYLFIECYNVIKEFYLNKNSDFIEGFTSENITLKIPVGHLNPSLFDSKNRSQQLLETSKGLMQKTIYSSSTDDKGQVGFFFVNMFTYIQFDPAQDKHHIQFKIPKEIYNDMIPIESYCQLDLKLLEEFNSGNTIRLYEIFKSYAFKRKFTVSIDDLRKKLGFFKQGNYSEWKYFNAQVLKPAANDINKHKEFDIEVSYQKPRGSEYIEFKIIQHHTNNLPMNKMLSLDEIIDPETRQLNLLQEKYLATLIRNCNARKLISNTDELKDWIVSDLINQQKNNNEPFNWVHSCNAISKQLRTGVYTRPYSHYDSIGADK